LRRRNTTIRLTPHREDRLRRVRVAARFTEQASQGKAQFVLLNDGSVRTGNDGFPSTAIAQNRKRSFEQFGRGQFLQCTHCRAKEMPICWPLISITLTPR
jgi:hypothetical protein